ncbi:hypothetical protein [Thalassovita sp.]|uniref:hypothetical protein n=1 Tax=Thalassovita sp. TaxID=1979401 RepID=UPI002AAF2BE2|nr:hypothetical protein [Thalassovita sp.]
MRNAALVLGIIAGLIGMVVGFFSFGYTEFMTWLGEADVLEEQLENPGLIRAMSFFAPLLALTGGAMAKARALWGGGLMLISAAGMYHAFGFNAFTMFPIGFAGMGGLLAIAAGKPDAPKAHF